jgi:competence protein ComEC
VRSASLDQLPEPGARVRTLASLRTEDGRRALLVVASPTLLEPVAPPSGVHAVRARLANALLNAAGLDLHRLRAAELAASLALGRKDLMPWGRKELWRRSGLSHVLAVSGLHVGLLAAFLWLVGVALRARPNVIRALLIATIPAYALLAGAGTSAQRAALMLVVYLLARMAGRHLVGLAAVLLAVWLLVLLEPALVLDPGFQLTAAITAALVRWVPSAVRSAPLPRALAGIVAVPVIAQLTAAPIVLAHFRELSLGACTTNLLVPLLLPLLLAAALLATLLAPLVPPLAAAALTLVGVGEQLLLAAGSFARGTFQVTPSLPLALAWLGLLTGLLALAPQRRARVAAAGFVAFVVGIVGWSLLPASPDHTALTLAPVSDGAALVATTAEGSVLVDAGHWRREATRLLADRRLRRLEAIIFTHADEDHVGGAEPVLEATEPRVVVFPAWLSSQPGFVAVRRTARAIGAREHPVARGSAIEIAGMQLETVWPPYPSPPLADNDLSLVARMRLGNGTSLITGDLTTAAERLAVGDLPVASDVLVVPHHGSKGSCSRWLLDRVQPQVALIPAGEHNLHNHPHPELLARLAADQVDCRWPARDGWCGARWHNATWALFPERTE